MQGVPKVEGHPYVSETWVLSYCSPHLLSKVLVNLAEISHISFILDINQITYFGEQLYVLFKMHNTDITAIDETITEWAENAKGLFYSIYLEPFRYTT